MDIFEILTFAEKGFWFGVAAIGFAVLFNVPKRTLFLIFILAAVGGITKAIFTEFFDMVILGSLIGASIIGFSSIRAAHSRHAPPLIFSIPAIIPIVPGRFVYKTMIGITKLTNELPIDEFNEVLQSTINNGFKSLFILMCLTIGVSMPLLITRKESAKKLKI